MYCIVFLLFLIIFNIGSFMLGRLTKEIPFEPSGDKWESHVENLLMSNFPISIVSSPTLSDTSHISIFCGLKEEIHDRSVTLSGEFYLNAFSLCDDLRVEIWPKQEDTGLWIRGRLPLQNLVLFATRLVFIGVVSIAFYFLFRSGANNSFMRSILITQASVILILDPLELMSIFFPSIRFLHALLSCIGWWRAVAEIFAEYGPLLRQQKSSVYRTFAAVPSIILFIVIASERISRSVFVMSIIGYIGAFILPIAAVLFLIQARRVYERKALTVHVVSGAMAMTVAYLMKVLRVTDDDFRDSLFCETAEISFVGAYAMFQMIFQFGGSNSTPGLGSQGQLNRYETIDGMLEAIGDFGNEINFQISDHEE